MRLNVQKNSNFSFKQWCYSRCVFTLFVPAAQRAQVVFRTLCSYLTASKTGSRFVFPPTHSHWFILNSGQLFHQANWTSVHTVTSCKQQHTARCVCITVIQYLLPSLSCIVYQSICQPLFTHLNLWTFPVNIRNTSAYFISDCAVLFVPNTWC